MPSITTRGMGTAEMHEIADVISTVIDESKDVEVINTCAERVRRLCDRFPIYREKSVGV